MINVFFRKQYYKAMSSVADEFKLIYMLGIRFFCMNFNYLFIHLIISLKDTSDLANVQCAVI